MIDETKTVKWWFWAVAVFFLLLNLIACWGYWLEMTLSLIHI